LISACFKLNVSEMKIEIEPEIADHMLPLVRGLKLSRDLDLAEQAIRAEREILKAQNGNSSPRRPRRRKNPDGPELALA